MSRNLQDGQTIDLPVGPDTSRLLAEVVASGTDELLRERLKISGRDASRYIDDYTISTPDGQAGENLIAALRQPAAQFELELNSEKSEVISTAVRHDVGWKQAVRATIPKSVPDSAIPPPDNWPRRAAPTRESRPSPGKRRGHGPEISGAGKPEALIESGAKQARTEHGRNLSLPKNVPEPSDRSAGISQKPPKFCRSSY